VIVCILCFGRTLPLARSDRQTDKSIYWLIGRLAGWPSEQRGTRKRAGGSGAFSPLDQAAHGNAVSESVLTHPPSPPGPRFRLTGQKGSCPQERKKERE
jgi:hypothetical protein